MRFHFITLTQISNCTFLLNSALIKSNTMTRRQTYTRTERERPFVCPLQDNTGKGNLILQRRLRRIGPLTMWTSAVARSDLK